MINKLCPTTCLQEDMHLTNKCITIKFQNYLLYYKKKPLEYFSYDN
jgi:hypothetical protein